MEQAAQPGSSTSEVGNRLESQEGNMESSEIPGSGKEMLTCVLHS